MARRTELVKYPLIIDINKKILYYLSYLQDKDDKLIQGRSQYEANRGTCLGKILPNVIDFCFHQRFYSAGMPMHSEESPLHSKIHNNIKG